MTHLWTRLPSKIVRSKRGSQIRSAIWAVLIAIASSAPAPAGDGNRFAYLDGGTPYYPSRAFPKLATPQWVGEPGVEAVVVLAIDDMREPKKYETFLRPILQRLKQIDGRAGLSIMTCRVKPEDPQLKSWLDEGLSLEIHTVDHPCPLFKEGDFAKAKSTYDRCVDLLAKVPGNVPVAFRMPCCDGLNTVSPRFYAEIFSKTTPAGEFLQIDSSVFNLFTDDNPQSSNLGSEPRKSTDRFSKYIPSDHGFLNLIENYSYPYVIDRLCWEFPCVVPSDWEASHCHKSNNPLTVADWERALDLTVRNQGVMTMVFHPHGWIKNSQMVELIDYAVKTYGRKVKFLNFREALDRINKNLLAGNPLRDASGNDNGVRILDVNADGYLDVVVGNAQTRLTRIWKPKTRTWSTTGFPCGLDQAAAGRAGSFAVFEGPITSVVGEPGGERPDQRRMGGWDFNGQEWVPARWFPPLFQFLLTVPVTTSAVSRAPGSRLLFRDLNGDGRCEAIVSDSKQTSIFYLTGSSTEPVWNKAKFTLPPETAIPNPLSSESGLRFEDVDGDGDLDVLFSNADRYSLHLFDSMETGWSQRVFAGRRGSEMDGDELPMIARADATNNGAWFRDGHLWVQNEETDKWKNLVAQRAADDWLKDVSIGPLTPERSLQAIRVHPGFTVELVAAEPLVVSPVAFEWGADGKLWVAEMVDYPLGIDGKGKPGGAVVVLEDTDGDGRYDKRTVFAGQLNLPNGILPWGKGVLVTAAPDIIYLADTDGDGVADKREVLYTGFRQGNPQHRPNGLVRGLDNWIYCANGGESGGMILSTKTGKTTNVGRRDFRIRPETGEIETEFGTTQFLRSRDDWGDWFGNHNANPMWQYVLEERYLRRNPLAFAAEVRHDVSVKPGPSRVYPISHTEKRFNDFSMQNHFTSACSAIVYGDELFGPEFEGNTFVSEPVHNLIHREVARRDGILFRSERSKDEQQSEFLASRDNWFRPTMLKVGPDGALYFADVYRKVIEHPQYIPKELHARLDFRAGVDRGRLYRVFPRGKRLRPTPKLAASSSLDLVAALDSPNRWQRDTAQQLLIERKDPAAISPLTSLAAKAKLPQGRVQALWTLEDLNALPAGVVTKALSDGHWGVRKNAVRLAEAFLGNEAAIQEAVLCRVDDADAAVQLQTAYALGEWRDGRSADALGRLALRHVDDPYFLTGVLSSLDRKNIDQILAQILSDPRANVPESLMKRLLNAAVMLKSDRALATALSTVTRPEALQTDRAATFLRLAAIWHALSRMGTSFDRLETEATPEIRSAIRRIDAVLADARNQLNDPNAPEGLRIAAVKILGLRERDVSRDIAALAVTLVPQNSAALQIAAVDRLGELKGDEVPGLLLRGWKSHRPAIRDRIVEILLRRNYWRRVLLDAVEKRSVGAGDVEMVRWQEIVRSSEPEQQKRAEKILAGLIDPNRQKAVQQFRSALTLTGNAGRGKPLFVKHCATCHKLGDAGQNVGPDLASRKDKSPESLLIAVLDPNRNVEPKYVAYVAVTTGGRTYNGILADESANGLVLIGAKGDRVELLRSQIEELTSTSKSLMPEGLEKDLSPQAVADVIAYIQAFDSPAPRR